MVATSSYDVGVDVEPHASASTIASVAQQLHPQEREEVETAAPAFRAYTFTQIWTRKEAYLKGLGVGLTRDLELDDLSSNRSADPAGWCVLDIALPKHAASIAVRSSKD